MIEKDGQQYKVASPLLLLFSSSFLVWQMGVLYFSGTTMSLFGRTPIPVTAQGVAPAIAAGYIASILFLCLLPRKAVLAERILLPVALTATAATLLPLPGEVITALFYIEVFVCVFSIGVMGSVAAQHFTPDTTWRDGILCTAAGGALIAVLQSDIVKVSFTVFTLLSVLLIAGITVFFYLIPAKIEVPYVKRENGVKTHKLPGVLFIGLLLLIGFSSLLLCFATAFAESFGGGVWILYLSAAAMTLALALIRKKLGGRSIRVFGGFFMLAVFGFVLAVVSVSMPSLRYAAVVLLGFIVALANMWIYFSAVAFGIYPTRFIGAIVAAQGLLIVLLHAGLLELLRSNLTLLYGTYAVVSVALMLTYHFLEPYFLYTWKQKHPPEKETPSADTESDTPSGKNPLLLSEQERNLVELILAGYSGSSIATQMNITMNTQKSYRKNIYAKLDIHSKRELFELVSKSK